MGAASSIFLPECRVPFQLHENSPFLLTIHRLVEIEINYPSRIKFLPVSTCFGQKLGPEKTLEIGYG
jgi:hypothetical protein